jgi:parvulin-like peptidyl-prolyl isomerase
MFKKIFGISFILVIIFSSISFAKIEFKELDDDIIAYVGDYKISLAELEEVIGEKSQHSAGFHGKKGSKVPKSMYLKAIMDKYLVVENAVKNKCKENYHYKTYVRSVKESYILNEYVKAEIIDKMKEEKDKQGKIIEIIENKPEELKDNYNIKVDNNLIKREVLVNGFDAEQVVATIDDYEICLADVFRKATPYYYDQINPDRISQEVLDTALGDIIKRAIILSEAMKLGYGKDVPELSKKEECEFLVKALDLKETENMTVSDEEFEKMFEKNKDYYLKNFSIKKYGIIVKKDIEELEKIKSRLENGEDFFEIAKKESEDETTKENGGVQDYIQKTEENITDAFFNLKNGDVSDIIKTRKGNFVIIKKLDGKYDELDELKAVIYDEIKAAKLETIKADRMPELRKSANIAINSKLLKKEDFFSVKDVEEEANKKTEESAEN